MKFFVGLCFGIGLGFVAGLLLAQQPPEEGSAQSYTPIAVLLPSSWSAHFRKRTNQALQQGRERYLRTVDELGGRYQKARSGEL